MATFVLVHGGWDGGWAWRGVAKHLQAAGHDVFTPTLTGSGERVHLARRDLPPDTHVMDIVNVLRYEKLRDVILVGISSGGVVITGVAECVPERLGHLIYLDAFVPEDGESMKDVAGEAFYEMMAQVARAYGDGWRVPHNPPDADRRTDFLLISMDARLAINNPAVPLLKHTYVQFTGKADDDPLTPIMGNMGARARAKGWQYLERPWPHWPILDQPKDISQLLLEVGCGASSAA